MVIDNKTLEELKNSFSPKTFYGKRLPEKLEVSDGTVFYLEGSGSVMVEHIMLKGKWWKKIVDGSSQVVLKEV